MRRTLTLAGALSLLMTASASAAGPITAEQDRADMMRQLGITALVPGPSGDESAPNAANTDEAKATPYPILPDPLRLDDGRPVRDAQTWRTLRRPQIAAAFEREVYGRIPADVPPVQWRVTATDRELMDFAHPVLARRVIGHVASPDSPTHDVNIRMTVVVPADAKGPVPLLVMFNYGPQSFPAPSQPTADEYDRINAALKALLANQDPALAPVFAAHQGLEIDAPPPLHLPQRDANVDLPPTSQLIAAGWGYALLDPTTAQPDNGEGLRSGIIGLVNHGGPRKPDEWGALRAWAWAAGRAFDWLSADPTIDAHRIGIEGVSRYGKAALVTMAFDPRFAVGLIGSSGKGGATLFRRRFGEDVSNLATGEYYWFAGNFLKYDTKGVSKPGLDANDLPVDANELIALAAPRPLFISYGVPEAGDAKWLDHHGSWLAAMDAGRVYRLLGEEGVGTAGPREMPPPLTLIDGKLAWRQHTGGHTDVPNFRSFIAWAGRELPANR